VKISGPHDTKYEDGFWDSPPCNMVVVTDVSEVLAASITRAIDATSQKISS
jgi:hypothetical protein